MSSRSSARIVAPVACIQNAQSESKTCRSGGRSRGDRRMRLRDCCSPDVTDWNLIPFCYGSGSETDDDRNRNFFTGRADRISGVARSRPVLAFSCNRCAGGRFVSANRSRARWRRVALPSIRHISGRRRWQRSGRVCQCRGNRPHFGCPRGRTMDGRDNSMAAHADNVLGQA
jgi:hypothetical protein